MKTNTIKKFPSTFIVKKEILVHAKPSAVWDALTIPEKTQQYFFHCKVYSDWTVGSHITFKGRIFLVKKIQLSGTILRIIPEKLLHYNLKNNLSSGTSVVTIELNEEDLKTFVRITDDVGQEAGAESRYKRSVKGWEKVLKGLKALVEKEQAADMKP